MPLPPEIGDVLYLTSVTTGVAPDGHLLHSIKSPAFDGTILPWTAFDDVETTAGEAGSIVDSAIRVGTKDGRALGTFLVAVDSSGGLQWTYRERGDALWAPFEDVRAKAGNPGDFVRVAAGRMTSALHICGITTDGLLWHTIRHDDGSWDPFFDIGSAAGDLADPVQLACHGYESGALVPGLQLFVVSGDGHVWSTMRRKSDGQWTPFIDIKRPGRAGDPGRFIDVDCFAFGGDREVHVAGVTDDGRLWYAIRREDSSWKKRFTDIAATAGSKGRFVSAATARGAVAGATSDGGLWLTEFDRRSDAFAPFQDVAAEVGREGMLTSVALDEGFFAG